MRWGAIAGVVLVLGVAGWLVQRMWTSVEGSHIVFTALANNNEEIFIVGEDGLHPRNVTRNPLNDFLANLSPDGTLIAYNADISNARGSADRTQLFVMRANGREKQQLTTAGNNYGAGVSPDNRTIVYYSTRDGNREVYRINTDGSGDTRLTTDPADDRNPAYSPDGSYIIFASNRDGNMEIYRMQADGGNPVRLTTDPAEDSDPAYSADGTQIVFISTRSDSPEVWVMQADGSNARQVTHDLSPASHPWFSPDGTQIVYQSGPFYTSDIVVINADGADRHPLLPDGPPGWSPCWSR
ncbi:MAG: TolB family protein [Armatimonadota bacterium]